MRYSINSACEKKKYFLSENYLLIIIYTESKAELCDNKHSKAKSSFYC